MDWYSTFSVYKFDEEKTVFDKLFDLGFTILELSKLIMYEFTYKCLVPYWHEKLQLHYMDSDSLVLSFNVNNQELTNFFARKKQR